MLSSAVVRLASHEYVRLVEMLCQRHRPSMMDVSALLANSVHTSMTAEPRAPDHN